MFLNFEPVSMQNTNKELIYSSDKHSMHCSHLVWILNQNLMILLTELPHELFQCMIDTHIDDLCSNNHSNRMQSKTSFAMRRCILRI